MSPDRSASQEDWEHFREEKSYFKDAQRPHSFQKQPKIHKPTKVDTEKQVMTKK